VTIKFSRSLEEEMANLITFQQSYAASSKIITTVDQMLQTVISLKT
jgi:flagellar hook-associated protein 1 FlgK